MYSFRGVVGFVVKPEAIGRSFRCSSSFFCLPIKYGPRGRGGGGIKQIGADDKTQMKSQAAMGQTQ